MHTFYSKHLLTLMIITFPFATYASANYNQGQIKTYTVRVSSFDPNVSTQIYGSIMRINQKNTDIESVSGAHTPYEFTTNSVGVSTMLMSDHEIKVDILEKDGDKQKMILSGYGKNLVSANDSSNTTNYIYSK